MNTLPAHANLLQLVPTIRSERHYGEREFNCYQPRPPQLLAVWQSAAATHPEREAVVDAERRLSYRALDRESNQLANALLAQGLQAGDRVVINMGNRAEFAAIFLACLKSALIAMPVGYREKKPALLSLYRDAGVKLVFFDSITAEQQPDTDDVDSLLWRVSCESQPVEAVSYRALLDSATAAAPPGVSVDEEDCVCLLYTSGTTGKPKGARLTHLSIVHSLMHFQRTFALQDGERTVIAVPASHVTGLVAQWLTVIGCAGTSILLQDFTPARFVTLAVAEKMSYTILVPAMYSLLLLKSELNCADLSHWRIGAFGGAPMPDATRSDLASALPDLSLHNSYGSTETSSPATLIPVATQHPANSIGKVVECGEIVVADDSGQPVATGQSGEFWIKGPMVVPGYWNNPTADTASFENGYWKSGDIGCCDEDGFHRIFDRKKDMINRGGYKVYSAEVENQLVAHPHIVEAAVVSYPCAVLGERVHAHIFSDNVEIDRDALQSWMAARLADYKVPERITVHSTALPRNANGKLVKQRL